MRYSETQERGMDTMWMAADIDDLIFDDTKDCASDR